MLVLMVSWLAIAPPKQEIQILELFAGKARLARLASSLGIPAQAHDLVFDPDWKTKSAMNINESAGFMLL